MTRKDNFEAEDVVPKACCIFVAMQCVCVCNSFLWVCLRRKSDESLFSHPSA